MKKGLGLSSNLIFLFIILLSVIYAFFPTPNPEGDQQIKVIDSIAVSRDSMTYNEFLRKQNELDQQKRNFTSTAEGTRFLFIGTSRHADSACYLYFPGYYLASDYDYIIRNGRTFIRKQLWKKETDYSSMLVGEYEEETRLRYYTSGKVEKGTAIGIPVSKATFQFTNIAAMLIGLLFVLFAFYCIYSLPGSMLFRIANGEIFNEKNTRALYIAGYFLIGFYLLLFLSSVLISFFLLPNLPEGISFSYYSAFKNHIGILISGLVVILFARSFDRGMVMKVDQDLTV